MFFGVLLAWEHTTPDFSNGTLFGVTRWVSLVTSRQILFCFSISSDNWNIKVLYRGSEWGKGKGQGTGNYKEEDSQQGFLGTHPSFLVA